MQTQWYSYDVVYSSSYSLSGFLASFFFFFTKQVNFKELLCIRSQGQSLSTLTFGHFSFNLRATPVMVPPVPAPATSISTFPVDTGKASRVKGIVHLRTLSFIVEAQIKVLI